MTIAPEALQEWVDQVAALTQPKAINWCTGTEEEYPDLIDGMLADGRLWALKRKSGKKKPKKKPRQRKSRCHCSCCCICCQRQRGPEPPDFLKLIVAVSLIVAGVLLD